MFSICKEYEARDKPVADHHFHASGYLGEVALRALLAAGLLERQAGSRLSLYSCKPTARGLEYYRKLVKEGWCPDQPAKRTA